MMNFLTLQYRRVGETSSGQLIATLNGEIETLKTFEGEDFFSMMQMFSDALRQNPEAGGAIQRVDRPGLLPMFLSTQDIELLREDPVEAVKRMHVPPQVSEKPVSDKPVNAVPPLLAGYDVLAESFGDRVYARIKHGEIECISCGNWASISAAFYACYQCGVKFPIADLAVQAGWGGIDTARAIKAARARYFLPRVWNDYRNWISLEKLTELYDTYQQEKEKSCNSIRS
jgi:hypothetical protein